MKEVHIYTDGACLGNPGPGGWGAILLHNGKEKEISGGEIDTTNNRMEMKAAIEALNALRQSCKVVLHTDSKYVQQGISEWVKGWEKRGWKTSDKKPVKNVDLWLALLEAEKRHTVTWKWVKGHAEDDMNNRADALACAAAKEVAKGSAA